MENPQHERETFTQADRLAQIIEIGLELDRVLDMFRYMRANDAADRLTSEPRNASLVDVMRTGRTYLSPLPGSLRHYCPAFITVARHTIKENRGDDEIIIRKLYDFIGDKLIKPEVAEWMSSPQDPIRD